MNYVYYKTPTGIFTVIADQNEVVFASGFTANLSELLSCIAPTLRPVQISECEEKDFVNITAAIKAYFAGDLTQVKDIPVCQRSGKFIELAWQQLRASDVGEVMSYAGLARSCGNSSAVRAAAQACARNAAALFIPCHRVIRSDGSLGGFRYGLKVKQWLIDYENKVIN